MSYPDNDSEYRETVVEKVEESGSGWAITDAEGWSFFIEEDSPVEPQAGMSVRFYGLGIGSPVRGVFLDGQQVFYLTPDEHRVYMNEELYGKDAREWLRRWDEGRSVWSISMGGFGPGYEQALQIAAAEVLRWLLDNDPEWSEGSARDIDSGVLPKLDWLGLSGAQWGGAKSLAWRLFIYGPIHIFTDEKNDDRMIQVQRDVPRAPETREEVG